MKDQHTNLRHWIGILSPLATPEPVSPQDNDAALASMWGRNRPWVTACLRAVQQYRTNDRKPVLPGIDISAITIPAPASEGSTIANAVWLAYARFACGDSSTLSWLTQACAALNPTALVHTSADNPEPWWQNEMLILHALHSFALLTDDEACLMKTLACADFHLREIQPDHATNEPWSIHAYANHPDGRVTAETLLHAGLINNGGTLSPVSMLVACDAVYAMNVAMVR